tara:strand:- start:81809 stop:82429 length:621 start_codon:yes stop_codon:yes gene_type:complete
MSLFEHEKAKYNVVHKSCDDGTTGNGRQLNELLTSNSDFHNLWKSLANSSNSFLEIGLGCGAILDFFKENDIQYYGIDISDYVVENLSKRGLNVKHMSCHDMSFEDDSFDIVQHLDGLEHIPVEWENHTLSEEVRVSKRYIFHANAMGDAWLDRVSKSKGFDEVHINIKDETGWDEFYNSNKEKYNYNIILKLISHNTYFTVLEKK